MFFTCYFVNTLKYTTLYFQLPKADEHLFLHCQKINFDHSKNIMVVWVLICHRWNSLRSISSKKHESSVLEVEHLQNDTVNGLSWTLNPDPKNQKIIENVRKCSKLLKNVPRDFVQGNFCRPPTLSGPKSAVLKRLSGKLFFLLLQHACGRVSASE